MSADIVILGLSITSSWGNGHATTYRGLVRGLAARGHRVLFLERDQPWYRDNRDAPQPAGARTMIYDSLADLKAKHESAVREADLVVVGSFVPDGLEVSDWVLDVAQGRAAFYDIDTPLTLAKLEAGECNYVSAELIRRFPCYLSFTGGPTLERLEREYGSPMARVLHCAVDPDHYCTEAAEPAWDLGYLGTYSEDRQPAVDKLLIQAAMEWPEGRFAVAGPGYPGADDWPDNVDHMVHLAPAEHPPFYEAQRFTLNVTRAPMKKAGYSPSVRLFEAAACATPIISDWWEGLDSLLRIGTEVLVAEDTEEALKHLRSLPEGKRKAIGKAARRRILAEHTPEHRAMQLEEYLSELYDHVSARPARSHGRDRQGIGRPGPGLALELKGQGAD